MENKIYTHDEASRIIELFENILDRYGIIVPSPEDDQRDVDNMVGLYGSTYSDLLDDVENTLIDLIDRAKAGSDVVPNVYSGAY